MQQQQRTFDEVREAAEELGCTLTIEGQFLELTKGEFGGRFTNDEVGRAQAYDSLLRYKQRREQINESQGRRV